MLRPEVLNYYVFVMFGTYSELYNRVSKILLQNGDWTQNEWYPIL